MPDQAILRGALQNIDGLIFPSSRGFRAGQGQAGQGDCDVTRDGEAGARCRAGAAVSVTG